LALPDLLSFKSLNRQIGCRTDKEKREATTPPPAAARDVQVRGRRQIYQGIQVTHSLGSDLKQPATHSPMVLFLQLLTEIALKT
jgi:hypothetical protein